MNKTPFQKWINDNGEKPKKVARDLGISRSYLYQISGGFRTPSPELSMKIHNFTNKELSLEELLFPFGAPCEAPQTPDSDRVSSIPMEESCLGT